MKILAVDDKPDNVELLCQILEDEYDMIRAYDGAECLELSKEQQPDLIILDIKMPTMDGYEVFERLQQDERTCDIPVIFLTASFKDTDSIVKGLNIGAFDYITKPIDDDILKARVGVAARVRRAEKELESFSYSVQQRLLLHREQTPLASIEWNTDFEVTDWNPSAERIFGFKRDEAIGQHLNSLIVSENGRGEANMICHDLIANKNTLHQINENITKHGKIRLCEWYNTPLVSKGGQVICVASLVDDITERRQAQEALVKSEQRLEKFFEASYEGLFFHDQGKILDINPTTVEIFGYAPEETIGRNLLEFIAPESQQELREQIGLNAEGPYETIVVKKDGSKIPVVVRAKNLEHKGRPTTRVVALRDITERKQAEEALQKAHDELENKVAERTVELALANKRLKELDQLKSMFIASMSHELRTPLSSIIGFTGLVLDGVEGDINDQQREDLTRVKKAGRHLLALITDVIDISKIESGRLEVFPETIILDELIEEAVQTIETDAIKKGLSIEVDVPRGLDMYTDQKRLLQCLLNYLSNAVKYSETGTVRVSAQESDGFIEMTVTDTGIGIADEDMPRLFDAFERMDSHLRIKAGGTGLGLYLTRKIATEMLGGDASAESKLGKGSTFHLKVLKTLSVKKPEKGEEEALES